MHKNDFDGILRGLEEAFLKGEPASVRVHYAPMDMANDPDNEEIIAEYLPACAEDPNRGPSGWPRRRR